MYQDAILQIIKNSSYFFLNKTDNRQDFELIIYRMVTQKKKFC